MTLSNAMTKEDIYPILVDMLQEMFRLMGLGQDEDDVVFNDIVEGLADRTLAGWMTRSRS